jgi:hypothetical protein
VEDSLFKIEQYWKDARFVFSPICLGPTALPVAPEVLLEALEDHQLTLQVNESAAGNLIKTAPSLASYFACGY